ncbi:LysR family transcriptional regulator [Paracandidimonas lactea]|uniref:LysR family transcriptional regulator n=1 Tax=Paracandidimonas lactea TaxID=2895524 RepID=UPI0034E29D90
MSKTILVIIDTYRVWIMDLRQIRYFQCVADELSFTRAAQVLHMAQPPLSRQIKMLEETLGVDLFERVGRGIRLTEAGRYFRDQTELITQKLEETVQATQRIGRHQRPRLGVGFVPSTLYGYMPAFIRELRSLDPDAEISFVEMITLEQFNALKTGRIDIGIGRMLLEDDEIERLVLWEEPLALAIPATHRWVRRKHVSAGEIQSEPLILYPARPRPSYADHILALFQKHGCKPHIAQEVNELQTAIGFVAAGMGVAIVPDGVRALHREDVRYVPVRDADFTSPIMLSWRRNDNAPFLQSVLALARRTKRGAA